MSLQTFTNHVIDANKKPDTRLFTRPYTTIILRIVLLLIAAYPTTLLAFSFTATSLEFLASTDICKYALAGKVEDPNLGHQYQNNKDEYLKDMIWKVGGWHYCGGAIKLERAKSLENGHAKTYLLNQILKDINYSYSRIDKSNSWAVDMAITAARTYQELGRTDKAFEKLDEISASHPQNPQLITMYGLLYYQKEDYLKAMSYLEKADEIAAGKSAQIIYFKGLTAFKLGDISAAKEYADQSAALGYPLTGLKNMIDRKQK